MVSIISKILEKKDFLPPLFLILKTRRKIKIVIASIEATNPKTSIILPSHNSFMKVGVIGFEPTASSSRTKRATGLRYTPNTIHLRKTLSIRF